MTPCEERMSLVSTIEQDRGYPLAPRIREAFLNVSRYHFVPQYLKQEQPMIWVSYDTREIVYQDRVFVTKVNQKMMPCSSSTQPSLMAAMLESLDLFPGARVLEIGTGTGYNAALLSKIVGQSGSVMSIDVDEDLVCLAQQRMREAGYTNIQVAQADALASLPPSLFDRIILTGGYPTILPIWTAALLDEGKMVGNILGTLATFLVCLTKHANEVTGEVLSTSGFFMSLYPSSDAEKDTIAPGARTDLSPFKRMPVIETGSTTFFICALDDLSLKLFLEYRLPGIRMRIHYLGGPPNDWHSFARCLVYANSLATFSPITDGSYTVEVRGTFPLWSHLNDLYLQWESLGKPKVNQYKLSLDGEKYSPSYH